MALSDFFRINLPYGIQKNDNGEWMAFNREYVPLGCNDRKFQYDLSKPTKAEQEVLYTAYKQLTDAAIVKIAGDKYVRRNDNGEITVAFLYDDGTNPQTFPEHWDSYFAKIKALSKFDKK